MRPFHPLTGQRRLQIAPPLCRSSHKLLQWSVTNIRRARIASSSDSSVQRPSAPHKDHAHSLKHQHHGFHSCLSPDDVFREVSSNSASSGGQLDPKVCTAAFVALCRLVSKDRRHVSSLFESSNYDDFLSLVSVLTELGPQLSPRGMANVMFSLGQLGKTRSDRALQFLHSPDCVSLLEVIFVNFPSYYVHLKPQEVAQFFMALGHLPRALHEERFDPEPLFHRAAELSLSELRPQHLSNEAWGLAKIGPGPTAASGEKARQLASALATRGIELLQAPERAQFTAMDVSLLFWSLAKSEMLASDPKLERSLWAALHRRVEDFPFDLQSCSNLLLALVELYEKDFTIRYEPFFVQILDHIDLRIATLCAEGETTQQGIANSLFSFSSLHVFPRQSLASILKRPEATQNSHRSPEALSQLFIFLTFFLPTYRAGLLPSSLASSVRGTVEFTPLLERLCGEVEHSLRKRTMTVRGASSIALNLLIMQEHRNHTFLLLLEWLCQPAQWDALARERDQMLFDRVVRIFVFARVLQVQLPVPMPKDLNVEAWLDSTTHLRPPFKSPSKVDHILKDVLAEIAASLPPAESFSLDPEPSSELKGLLPLELSGRQGRNSFIVELDGPARFLHACARPKSGPKDIRPIPLAYDGPTLFRNKLLTALGYTVISVPYYEFDVTGSRLAQKTLLSALLLKAGIVKEHHLDGLRLDERLLESIRADPLPVFTPERPASPAKSKGPGPVAKSSQDRLASPKAAPPVAPTGTPRKVQRKPKASG